METEVETAPDERYLFYSFPERTVQFQVRAICNCFIMLSNEACPAKFDPVIEVLLGIASNKKSAIRKNRTEPDKVTVDTPGIIARKEFQGYWLMYEGGNIQVGKENEDNPFISWTDPEPIEFNYIGFCTGVGAPGEWIYNCETFQTRGSLMYAFRPLYRYHLNISVQAEKGVVVALTSGREDTRPIYEVVIGGSENSGAAIRYNKEMPEKVFVEAAGLLSTGEQKNNFSIHFYRGLVRFALGKGTEALMEWQDPTPFNVTHFGIKSCSMARWNIQIVNDAAQDYSELIWSIGQRPRNTLRAGILDDLSLEVIQHDLVFRGEHELVPGYYGRYLTHSGNPVIYGWADYDNKVPLTIDSNYQILGGLNFSWVPFVKEKIPINAIVGGLSAESAVLYVGRMKVDDKNVTIGRIDSGDGVLYATLRGELLTFTEGFEILVQD